jgi:hypothetical protein
VTSRRPREPPSLRQPGSPPDDLSSEREGALLVHWAAKIQDNPPSGAIALIRRAFSFVLCLVRMRRNCDCALIRTLSAKARRVRRLLTWAATRQKIDSVGAALVAAPTPRHPQGVRLRRPACGEKEQSAASLRHKNGVRRAPRLSPHAAGHAFRQPAPRVQPRITSTIFFVEGFTITNSPLAMVKS